MTKIKLNNQAVGPFPAMIVGAMKDGKPTYTTVGAGGCACLEPVLCVSLKDTHYITDSIVQGGYFSVNIPSSTQVQALDYCGMVSGKDTDKSALFSAFFDEAGTAPMIAECPLSFLCKVCDTQSVRGFTMFFGEIVAAYASESCLTDGRPDALLTDPVIMMGMRYCSLGEVVGTPFSEGKKRVVSD